MSDDLICIEVDPADYGWTRRPALDDADVVDVLRLLRAAREAAAKLSDRHLALRIETVLSDQGPLARRLSEERRDGKIRDQMARLPLARRA
jgi:hypothetical protein